MLTRILPHLTSPHLVVPCPDPALQYLLLARTLTAPFIFTVSVNFAST